jgi:hypothetical protein
MEKKIYYKEFKSIAEMEEFIHIFKIDEKNIIDSKFVRQGLVAMWHYV